MAAIHTVIATVAVSTTNAYELGFRLVECEFDDRPVTGLVAFEDASIVDTLPSEALAEDASRRRRRGTRPLPVRPDGDYTTEAEPIGGNADCYRITVTPTAPLPVPDSRVYDTVGIGIDFLSEGSPVAPLRDTARATRRRRRAPRPVRIE